jgi:hypothetical protein
MAPTAACEVICAVHEPLPFSPSSSGGHSADVRMVLHVDDKSLEVVQTSPSAIKLRESTAMLSGAAVLEIIVDGESQRFPVRVAAQKDQSRWIDISR